jgi:hypothetical protein
VLVLLVACADTIPVDEFGPAIWQAQCDWYVRCGALAAEDCVLRFYTPDETATAAVRAGLTDYDGEAAAACVAAYAELPCDTTEEYPDFSACDDVYRGHKTLGESCRLWLECEDGDCFYPDGGCDDSCCEGDGGTCDRARPSDDNAQLGESCELLGRWCARGLYCDTNGTNEPGICEPLPKHGETCEGACADLGDRCDNLTKICQDASVANLAWTITTARPTTAAGRTTDVSPTSG